MKYSSTPSTGISRQSSRTKTKKQSPQQKHTASADLYQEVTNRIIALLEQGTVPWQLPWSQYGLARNYATKHIYTGINLILMNNTKHAVPYFLTFRQAKELGGKIRKGAKAERVYFYTRYYKDGDGNRLEAGEAKSREAAGEDLQVISFLKYYSVFAITDVEGVTFDLPELKLYENERIQRCEQIVANMPNKPVIGQINSERAYYCPVSDEITLPDIKQFSSSVYYYVAMFHELIHSTGHQSRLSRSGIIHPNKFGSKAYSKEELIAEMGASFLCATAGIDYDNVTSNSAAYLAGWLQVLRGDKRFIFKAAAGAQKAANYILGH